MTKEERDTLLEILTPYSVKEKIEARIKAVAYIKGLEISDTENEPKKRTGNQHRALFTWFGMIEKEAENAGITWDMIIKHTHQLRVTKEALHGMCKLLQKALWGTESTKELNKVGHIDIIIDHFTELFAKEGLELPPFPHDAFKGIKLTQLDNLKKEDYPEYMGAPEF